MTIVVVVVFCFCFLYKNINYNIIHFGVTEPIGVAWCTRVPGVQGSCTTFWCLIGSRELCQFQMRQKIANLMSCMHKVSIKCSSLILCGGSAKIFIDFGYFVLIWRQTDKKTRNPEAELQGPVYWDRTTNCLINYWIR